MEIDIFEDKENKVFNRREINSMLNMKEKLLQKLPISKVN